MHLRTRRTAAAIVLAASAALTTTAPVPAIAAAPVAARWTCRDDGTLDGLYRGTMNGDREVKFIFHASRNEIEYTIANGPTKTASAHVMKGPGGSRYLALGGGDFQRAVPFDQCNEHGWVLKLRIMRDNGWTFDVTRV
ncbi:hypothetical protein [Nonomuraea sp. NPDC005692]|uniref:hypothetical protein n=1 Tax=Nonomuraea sp. NPDC005692 TaxID=3157168 RepID=UPI0033C9B73B